MLAVREAHALCAALCGSNDLAGLAVAERIAAMCPEDISEYAAYVREALCCYVNSRAWMHAVAPPPLTELLDPDARSVGPIAQLAYDAYFCAARAYAVAAANHESYHVWLLALMRGPQACVPVKLIDGCRAECIKGYSHFLTFDQHHALAHVRATLDAYLATLGQATVGLWALPPAPPPSVPSILRTHRI